MENEHKRNQTQTQTRNADAYTNTPIGSRTSKTTELPTQIMNVRCGGFFKQTCRTPEATQTNSVPCRYGSTTEGGQKTQRQTRRNNTHKKTQAETHQRDKKR